MNDKNSKSRSLILLTALVCVVILAATWFLAVSPTLNGASEAASNAAAQESQNANTQVEVNKLRQQFEKIDEYEAQLAALQVQIPTAPGYPDLQRMFAAVALENEVVITSLQFGRATALEGEVANSAADTGAEADAGAEADNGAESGDGASEGSDESSKRSVEGLYGIPISVSVTGKYDNVQSFLKALQTSDARLVLVDTVSLATIEAGSTDTTKADDTAADTNGVFSGLTFVLTTEEPTEEPDEATTDTEATN